MNNLDDLIRQKQSTDYVLYSLRELKIHLKNIPSKSLSKLLEVSLDRDGIKMLHDAILELNSNQ